MNIAVFCGAKLGVDEVFSQAARELGGAIASRGIGLVYGGGGTGLMGVLADAVLQFRGKVIGVIPQGLVEAEAAHSGLERLEIVQTMHERKARMSQLADAFLALPGGFGTLDELFEILTWAQLGFHQKPIGLCNVAGFFNPLLDWMEKARQAGLLAKKHQQLLWVAEDPIAILDHLCKPALLRSPNYKSVQ